MSEVLSEIELICKDCLALKNSVYKNEIIFKATKEQEAAFYRMLDSIINRLELYMNKFKDTNHVIATEFFAHKMQAKVKSEEISYDFEKMRETLTKYYREFKDISDEDTNFVAATVFSILSPLRIISEKLYQELVGRPFDESLSSRMNE